MPEQPIKFNEVRCDVTLFNRILSVLQERPYKEVGQLIDDIKTGFKAIPLPPPLPVVGEPQEDVNKEEGPKEKKLPKKTNKKK